MIQQGRYVDLPARTAALLEQVGFVVQHWHQAMLTAREAQLTLDGREERQRHLRRFPEKNLPFQKVDAGLITMSYLGNCGSRFNRASTASIATFPSAIPFVYTWRLSSTTG